MINRSLQGISGLMEPRITALRKVENVQRFDPLLTKGVWWDNRMGDDTLQTRGNTMRQSGLIGYGRRKKRPMSIPPPAMNLEKRYKLQGGRGLRMAGGGLRMAGAGLPIRLSNAQSMNYT
jgi:hypothetical protein